MTELTEAIAVARALMLRAYTPAKQLIDSGEAEYGLDGEAFKQHAERVGLSPTDLGREFLYYTDRVRIVGFKPRARVNNVIVETVGHTAPLPRARSPKRYSIPAPDVRSLLGKVV